MPQRMSNGLIVAGASAVGVEALRAVVPGFPSAKRHVELIEKLPDDDPRSDR